jgi:hypothetical protein
LGGVAVAGTGLTTAGLIGLPSLSGPSLAGFAGGFLLIDVISYFLTGGKMGLIGAGGIGGSFLTGGMVGGRCGVGCGI